MALSSSPPSGDLHRLILMMRLSNMALSMFTSFAAFLSLLGDDLASGVLAVYLMSFSCLLCCFETHLKAVSAAISDNFGFLYSAKGRASFLVFVSLLCFSQGLLGKLAGCLMLGNALFTFYVIHKYPEYEEIHAKYGMEDAAAVARRRGAEYALNNPQAVQKAAATGAGWATEIGRQEGGGGPGGGGPGGGGPGGGGQGGGGQGGGGQGGGGQGGGGSGGKDGQQPQFSFV